ncbi:hydroxymethylglutaryl-CoA lyase, mitochondrial [Galendromus occidentalis]|uniref:hydroxymethylglutaryl-CoA lyase n=1 Tax=Galendromus occidentalis TaxID=34638 RepID=A0AAJ6QYI1_9ACAR|nr:hydroxymethylglutaryl-CoA lyase, mitochondrial [Galendromus occidentalis]
MKMVLNVQSRPSTLLSTRRACERRSKRPDFVRIVEVGPRDGLQNESELVPCSVKVELINRLAQAGLRSIEAGAFVSPRWVPQMADSSEVLRNVAQSENVSYSALVPNSKGMERALACGVSEVAVFASASETFSLKNINCSIEESFARFEHVLNMAKAHGVRVRGYLSCVTGCPYEGFVPPTKVAELARRLYDMGCDEISLGDTIGVGTPGSFSEMLEAVLDVVPVSVVAVHCHDTYGQALANILTAVDMGISVVDASVAGLGGCPYAKGSSGNVATEDVVYMLHGMGIRTGIDMQRLVDAGEFICKKLGKGSASKVARALRG